MEIKREMDNLSLEDLCRLMCGSIEEDKDDEEVEDDRATIRTVQRIYK